MDKGLTFLTLSGFKIKNQYSVCCVSKMYFFIINISSDSEIDNKTNPSLAELKKQLENRVKKSLAGNKYLLINRIYWGMIYCFDSDQYCGTDRYVATAVNVFIYTSSINIGKLLKIIINITNDENSSLSYHINIAKGGLTICERQMY